MGIDLWASTGSIRMDRVLIHYLNAEALKKIANVGYEWIVANSR